MMGSSFATVCAPTLPMTWTGLTSLRMTTVLPSQEEEFLKLTRRIFAGDKHADVLACLKRAVVHHPRAPCCIPAPAQSGSYFQGASHQGG